MMSLFPLAEPTSRQARRERDRKQVFGQLQEIFEMADVDGSGTLKLEEAR